MAMASGGALPLHLIEEISHRVANEYAEAIASLTRAAAEPATGETRQALRRAVDRLHAHAENHRALLPPREEQVNLANYIGRLCAAFARASLVDRQVQLTLETDEIWLASDRAWRLGLVVAELIRNAARHGLRGRAGAITVRITLSHGEMVCLVGDDGHHLSDLRSGRGMSLIRALAGELEGSVDWWPSERGCVACLRAPTELRRL
jgi:two-component sensor histidine kinase